MTLSTNIRGALQERLLTVDGLPSGIAWQGQEYEPDADELYVEATVSYTSQRQRSLGPSGLDRHEGVFLVDVVFPTPPHLNGLNQAEILSDAIRAKYTTQGTLTKNGTNVGIDYAERADVQKRDNGRSAIPIAIAWYCYSALAA